jgi:ATP-binding cassette subfamily B protein
MAISGVKQRDLSDCGAACLAYLAAHFGLRLPVARVRQLAGTTAEGSTALGLVEAARALGFSAKGVRGPPGALPGVPVPAIAHCVIDGRLRHYVVLVRWTARGARVMDPASGRVERWPRERFLAAWTGVLVLVAPATDFRPGDRAVPAWRRLAGLLAPHRAVLLQALAGAVVTTLLGLGLSFYVEQIVDRVIPDGNRRLLHLLGVGMLVVLAFRLALGALQSLIALRTAQQIDAGLILAYYRHLLRLPQPFFDAMRVGEVTSRVGDAVRIRNFLNTTLLNLVLQPLVACASLAAMFAWSWELALLSLALVPLHAALLGLVNWRNRTYQRQLLERSADLDAQLVESVGAHALLRGFGLEAEAEWRTELRLVRMLRVVWRAGVAAVATNTAGTLVTQAYLVAVLWVGAGLVLEAGLSPGQLMSCYTLAGFLAGPFTALLGLNGAVQEALAATDRLCEILDLELEADPGTVEFRPEQAGDLRLEGVGFRHPGRAAVLEDVTLTLPAGRLTVLAGESGGGKTTLLALLQRLHRPTAGTIRIGGLDLAQFRLDGYRRRLGVVAQQTQLLSGTILENLAPGDAAPDAERLLALCRDVGALDFIEALPGGFHARLGEGGANLSGGQRQRLAWVRALRRDAPILLLDEPTSALDPAAEARLVALARRECAAGRTVVVATHAAAFLAAADRVVELAGGRVRAVRDRTPPSTDAQHRQADAQS